ncbi:ATP-binding protein [Caldicellulosiruptoraceae bacterium PP1]
MKILKKALLINWHYYWNELIEFDTINFLTGKNASGKSTLIDALQLLLLGDTSGYFFNKAANDKSQRTLKGYLKGEIGDDGDIGYKYLREGRFTSYIACEFFDYTKKSSFTLGVVFDCFDDETYDHKFFILDDIIPDNRFIINKIPMSIKDLRTYLSKTYKKHKFNFFDSNRSYQEALKGKLGGLKNKYFSLFKKAVSFTPITDIEKFITEYVCDVKSNINIEPMQENIRYYKRLELDADMIEKKIELLEDISNIYSQFLEDKERYDLYSYIIERAKKEALVVKLRQYNEDIKTMQDNIDRLKAEQELLQNEIKKLKQEEESLIITKNSSDIGKRFNEIQKEKEDIESKINDLNKSLSKTINNIKDYALKWQDKAVKIQKSFHKDIKDFLNKYYIANITDNIVESSNIVISISNDLLKSNIEKLKLLGIDYFESVRESISSFKELSNKLYYEISNLIEQNRKSLEIINEEIENLKKGIKPYDKKLLDLKNEIKQRLSQKYMKDIEVHILADLLEIKDEKWKNAIEAYLHTQKFYLIVEPEYFLDALKIYDHLKNQKGYYDIGLVDTGKILEKKPKFEPNSLAQEVVTDNIYARYYINYILGRVIKCDKVEDLRKFEIAITDSCMLYQNYVARQLNPERWKSPYIGKKSIEEQINRKTIEKQELTVNKRNFEYIFDIVKNIWNFDVINKNEIEDIVTNLSNYDLIINLKAKLKDLDGELNTLDLSWLIQLDEKIKEIKKFIQEKEKSEREKSNKIVELNTTINAIRQKDIPELEGKIMEHSQAILERYTKEFIQDKGEPRFLKELNEKLNPSDVERSYSTQLGKSRNQKENRWNQLVSRRAEYNRDYKMSYDINNIKNDQYEKELKELKEIKLPEYKEKINDARIKAFEQFRDDFLAKLKSSIETVYEQIDELNLALKESNFGDDRYRFVVSPKSEYKKYYEMITDPLLLDGYNNISAEVFRQKHKEAIDELFMLITLDDAESSADKRAEIEKNIKRYTDYRTYLNFDLEVIDAEDRKQRLSKTLHKKSGGETQTPFYISVLASFAQLYRVKDRNASNTSRLIIFDEAFNKMDSERIRESIKLLRKFKLQAIISAPPEKIADIATLVDRNLCVIRNANATIVRAFDARKLDEDEIDGLQESVIK